jgi:phosphate transport system permease protein
MPILSDIPMKDLILGTTWLPTEGKFGFMVPITGTLIVTLIAMIIAIPISILSAIYLAEYASGKVRSMFLPLIDLLSSIPPVVYGAWGVLVIVPMISEISSIIGKYNLPFLTSTGYSAGYCVLSGGIVLAIMVFPLIISITEQIFRAVPSDVKEASLSVGATRWQMIKHVETRIVFSGIIAAVILGFSRALGETMAVLMVVGNVLKVPGSIFDPAYPLTALIANNYGEMMSIPLYDSAMLLAALILMLVVLFFTIMARLTLIRIERRLADE